MDFKLFLCDVGFILLAYLIYISFKGIKGRALNP